MMPTIDEQRASTAPSPDTADGLDGPRRWKWTSGQFHRLARSGLLGDRKVELIDGDLWELSSNPPHEASVSLACAALIAAFGPGFFVREEKTLDLGRRFQPQPDLAVVPGSPRDYASAHPARALLVVEVSDSSLSQDRGIKGHRYAQAGIADYWIVNLGARQLEVHRDPGPDPDRPGRSKYRGVTIVPADGHASPLAKPEARVAVAELLP